MQRNKKGGEMNTESKFFITFAILANLAILMDAYLGFELWFIDLAIEAGLIVLAVSYIKEVKKQCQQR